MPGALGVGVRVFIGWGPSEHITGDARDPRLRRGTIVDGPFGPGVLVEVDGGHVIEITNGTHWAVDFDTGGDRCISHECYLRPIDGDDEESVEDERELEGVT